MSDEVKEQIADETRDVSIRIIEYLIKELKWDVTDQPESEWYPFNLQDGIQKILINAVEGVCPDCNQHSYSDTDNMCPVCGQPVMNHFSCNLD